jgi:hypothetical protein
MTRTQEEVAVVLQLSADGMNATEIARVTGLNRRTICDWIRGKTPDRERAALRCKVCAGRPQDLPRGPYAYLLGLYLGDGHILLHRKGVYRLRIYCADTYPALKDECELAILDVMGGKVGRLFRIGCEAISSYSKHWLCLFPPYGHGMKHTRPIVLEDWQQDIVDRFPAPFLRGLIHSDGCRVLNRVNGTPYPRYHFSNASADIRALFGRACDQLGIEWRPNNARNLSVAARASRCWTRLSVRSGEL